MSQPHTAQATPWSLRPLAAMVGFGLAIYIAALPAFSPTIHGTELPLLWLPFALLNLALLFRPASEAPAYAVIYAAVSLTAGHHEQHAAFALVRIGFEIAQALVLVYVLDAKYRHLLNYPLQVGLYFVLAILITGVGTLLTLITATLLFASPSAFVAELASDPAQAWRHWWLGNSCAYLTVTGPIAYLAILGSRLIADLRQSNRELGTFAAMVAALVVTALVTMPPWSPGGLHIPADIRLALMWVPAAPAFALAARFRGLGSAVASLILSPLAILCGAELHPAHGAGLPPLATPMHVFLLVIVGGCNVIAAITYRLRRAMNEAHAASQAKSRFIALLNHELRTPLNAILGFSELMRLKNVRALEDAIGPAENIHASGQRLLAMIEGLLSQADRGASVFDLNKAPVRLGEVIAGAIADVEPEARELGCTIAFSVDERLEVEADPRAMRQMLHVLLGFPLRFVGPETAITVRAEEIGTDTIVEVSSRGLIGAAADDRDKLEVQLVDALALAHGARLTIVQSSRSARIARLTFFATRAAG